MLKRLVGFMALGSALAGCPVALADTVPNSAFTAGGWDGSARMRPTGEFSFCLVRHTYPGGVELTLARSPEGLFFVGLKAAGWALRDGDDATAELVVDDGAGKELAGSVIAEDTVLFTFPTRFGAVYAALLSSAKGLEIDKLSVTPDQPTWRFDLTGANEALIALGDCLARHQQGETASLAK